jgi:ABC-2 type transport system ATP-binding protein
MIVEVRGLRKTYVTHERGGSLGEVVRSVFRRRPILVEALKGIDLDIGEGERVGFLGPNGAGKSTTLKILTGVLHPTAGEARVLGMVPWRERKRYVGRIGAVFGQKSQLVWDIPPLDAFLMNQAIYGIPEAEFRRTLAELTELLGIGAIARQPTRNLSLGERMKCEFIMAMLHRPRIVFLDEPTIGLDVVAKEAIHGFVRRMNREGVTFILTTHDLDDVERLAERVVVINHGELVFDDALPALRSSLGARKRVRVSTDVALDGLAQPGLEVVERHGPCDAEYELDLAQLELDRFIAAVSRGRRILDMAIEEIPIERVIKALYARRPGGELTSPAAPAAP